MKENKLTGKCYCGGIKYQVTAEFKSQCFCHCRSCQLACGSPYAAWGTLERTLFEITHGSLKEINTSAGVNRGFCEHCGTSLTYRHYKRPDEVDICLATLDEPRLVRPEYHIWVSDKLPWVSIDDGLQQYPEWRTG